MVERDIKARGVKDVKVLDAMQRVPRHLTLTLITKKKGDVILEQMGPVAFVPI